jgi:hypothetical protein
MALVAQILTIPISGQQNPRLKEQKDREEGNYKAMKTISRHELISEELIREHVRTRINKVIKTTVQYEKQLRTAVRRLLFEAETGTEEPSDNTGINVLANLLEKIIPIIEDNYKMLTSSEEQRESFRNHIIHAIKNTLRPIESVTSAELPASLPESYEFTVDREILGEKIQIDLDPQDDGKESQSVEGEFIDIDKDGDTETDDFVELDDQNETGRNFAAETFKAVEKQIVDAYDMLADKEDQNLFYDYLLTNMLLYFDKFEDELSNTLPDTTTPEYEEESNKDSSEGEEESLNL